MPESTIPAVKAALLSTLTTAFAATPEVLVCWGTPDYLPDDIVSVQGASGISSARAMGTGAREEQVTLYVVCSAYRGGLTPAVQQAATEAAFALLDTVGSALRSDPTALGTARDLQLRGWELSEFVSHDPQSGAALGLVGEIAARIEVRART